MITRNLKDHSQKAIVRSTKSKVLGDMRRQKPDHRTYEGSVSTSTLPVATQNIEYSTIQAEQRRLVSQAPGHLEKYVHIESDDVRNNREFISSWQTLECDDTDDSVGGSSNEENDELEEDELDELSNASQANHRRERQCEPRGEANTPKDGGVREHQGEEQNKIVNKMNDSNCNLQDQQNLGDEDRSPPALAPEHETEELEESVPGRDDGVHDLQQD
jgi:hypothetical protein